MTMLKVRIEILNSLRGFEVHVVGPNGWPLKTFRSPAIEDARMCAEAQAAANDNCRIDDRTGVR